MKIDGFDRNMRSMIYTKETTEAVSSPRVAIQGWTGDEHPSIEHHKIQKDDPDQDHLRNHIRTVVSRHRLIRE